MQRYQSADLAGFLTALDRCLDRTAPVTVIGGSALALGHDVAIATKDIDTYQSGSRLEVLVVDAYDRAASKLVRGTAADYQQLHGLHQRRPLDRGELIARFQLLMDDYPLDPTEPRWRFYHFVEEVWGEIAALEVRPR